MTEPRPPHDASAGPSPDQRHEPWLEPERHAGGQPMSQQPADELTLRYREASTADTRQPAGHVRDAVRAHAQSVLASRQTAKSAPQKPAANHSRWKLSLLASVALAGLTGLLVLQFDRGSADEQETAFGGARMRDAVPLPPPASPQPAQDAAVAAPGSPARNAVPEAPAFPSGQAALPAPPTQASAGKATQDKAAPALPAQTAPSVQQTARETASKKRLEENAEAGLKDRPMAAEESYRPAPALAASPAPAPAPALPQAPIAPATSSRPLPFPASPSADAAEDPPAPAVRGTPTPLPPNLASSRSKAVAEQNMSAEVPSPTPMVTIPAAPIALPPPAPATVAAPPAIVAPAAVPPTLSRAPVLGELSRADEAPPSLPRRASITSTLPLASALQEAARKGRASELNRLLARGAPLNAADTAGRTPLMLAVISNHPAMVQRLLAAGANVGLVDRNGLTALQHARRLGRERIARLIEEAS